MTATLAARIARKLEPVIRRGLIVGEADCVRLYAVLDTGDADSECWSTELSRESDPALLAAEAAGIVEDESEADYASRFRLRCYCEGESVSEVLVRTKAERPSKDLIGDELLPKGESAEKAMLRQAMRHAETATRIALGSIERREATMLNTVEGLLKANAELHGRYMDTLKGAAEAMRGEREYEISLMREGQKSDAMKEGLALLRQVAPRIVARFTGDDIVGPLVETIAKLGPDQVGALVSSGMISEAEGKTLRIASEKARDSIGKKNGKALPAKSEKEGN